LLQQRTRWQVPLAALLGALPGCGGAIIVVTQYTYGRATFGALLAVLTATMGDAAFLLLAREPLTGIMVFAIGAGAGVVTGWVVDRLHGPEFMRVMPKSNAANPAVCAPSVILASDRILFRLWWLWLIPGVVFGMLEALQIDGDALLASRWIEAPVTLFGAIGALLSLALWLRSGVYRHDNSDNPQPIGAAVLQDTSFVTTWVVLAYLLFGLGVFVTGIDLGALFQAWTPLLPLVAILIGLLPGCGPQIVVTSLYLAGAVPFSAQLGNAISNDGDALFPAMALAPKAALLATFYSAIPALIVAYGYYGIWE
jgi:hypothetical protein